MKSIAIYGAGGFGREVLTLIQDINRASRQWKIEGFFDDGIGKGTVVNGYPVLGNLGDLLSISQPMCIAVAIGNPQTKQRIVGQLSTNAHIAFPTLIHPTALIGDSRYVEIGRGCIICAENIITTNVSIGNFVILNLACTTGHDTKIGPYSAFMPSVNISGEVIVGEGVYVGTGAKIINQTSVGAWSTVGAGAVVTKPLPEYCTAVGVPAKVIKINKQPAVLGGGKNQLVTPTWQKGDYSYAA